MGKWIKRLLLAGVILVVLLLAAVILVPILFKDKIEALVKEQVNKNLNANVDWGAWDITILRSFPDLTVTVADVKVCNREPFAGICLADIASLTATVDIKSLFGDRIDIKRIHLQRPWIHAQVLADGRANWDIGPASADTTSTVDTTASAFNIALREYSIERGRIIYQDLTMPVVAELFGLDHSGRGDFTQDLFVLSTQTAIDTLNVVYDGVRYLRHVRSTIKADLDMDMPAMKFTFKDNEVNLNQLALAFNGYVAMPTDDIAMDLTWDLKRNDLAALLSLIPAEFAKDLNGVDMRGQVAFNGHVKGVYNETTMPGFGLNIAVDNGRFKYPDLPESVERIGVRASIVSPQGKDLDGMVIDVPTFTMSLANNPIDARLHLKRPISDPDIDTEVKAKVDLANLKRVVPLEQGDELHGKLDADVKLKGVLSDIEAQRFDKFTAAGRILLQEMNYRSDSLPFPVAIRTLDLALDPRHLRLNAFAGALGRSEVAASGRMDNYLLWLLKDSALVGSFEVNSPLFDLNELMGPSTATTTEATADTSALEVIEVPGNIDFKLTANVGRILYDNLTLDRVKGQVHVHDQQVDLRGLAFGLFEGQVTMDGTYHARDPKNPQADLRYDVRDMDIESTVTYVETVQKMAPIAKTCKGRFSTSLTMRCALDQQMSPIMSSLTGEGTLRTRNVRIDGFQPLVDIAKALKIAEIQSTTLQDVNFSYEFRDGKMITKPFDVRIDRIQANVGGSTAFEDQAIDYDMKAKVPTELFGAQANQLVSGWLGQANQAIGSSFQLPKDIDVTVKITGTIQKPVVKPVFAGGKQDLKETIKEEIKQELNERIDKAKEEAIARAREEAARLLAEAQRQADDIKATARREAASVKAQAYKAADDELAKVTNPLAKAAAKLVADKAKQEADRKEQQVVGEADKRADGIVDAARKQGDALIRKAEETDTTVK